MPTSGMVTHIIVSALPTSARSARVDGNNLVWGRRTGTQGVAARQAKHRVLGSSMRCSACPVGAALQRTDQSRLSRQFGLVVLTLVWELGCQGGQAVGQKGRSPALPHSPRTRRRRSKFMLAPEVTATTVLPCRENVLRGRGRGFGRGTRRRMLMQGSEVAGRR